MTACRIKKDGSGGIDRVIPLPVILIVPAGQAAKKVQAFRVALSQAVAANNKLRTFSISAGTPIRVTKELGQGTIQLDYVPIIFTRGTSMMRLAAIAKELHDK